MRRRFSVLIAGALILAAACGRHRAPTPTPAATPATPMPPPAPMYADNGGGIRDSVRVILRSTEELADYWSRATSTQSSPPAVPDDVDFRREMVIVVAAGRMTPEDQIHVDSLLVRRELVPSGKREETLTIVVRTVEGCRRFRTDAFPLQIVRARKFDGNIKWEERTVRSTCLDQTAGSSRP